MEQRHHYTTGLTDVQLLECYNKHGANNLTLPEKGNIS